MRALLLDACVGSGDQAAIAERGQVLGREERERRRVAERAAGSARKGRAECLGGVLHQEQPVPVADRSQRRSVGGVPEEVHGKQRARARPDGGLGGLGIEAQGVLAHVREHRHAARLDDRLGSRVEGVGRADDLVPRLQPERLQRDHERVGAVRDTHAVRCPDTRSELDLRLAHERAENEPPESMTSPIRDFTRICDRRPLGRRIHERYRHAPDGSKAPVAATRGRVSV